MGTAPYLEALFEKQTHYYDTTWNSGLSHGKMVRFIDKIDLYLATGFYMKHTPIFCSGFHAYDNDCNITTLVDTVKKVLLLALQSGQLYPSSLRLINPLLNDIPQDRNPWYGYWSDPRDHQLCLNMTVPRRYKGAN